MRAEDDTQSEWPAIDAAGLGESAAVTETFPINAFMAGDDGEEGARHENRSVSHDNLTAMPGDEASDSHFELPAFPSDDLEPDHAQSGLTDQPAVGFASVGAGASNGWPIGAWGRYHLYVALGFGGVSLGVIGYFLVRPLVGGAAVSSSTTALILGCIGTIAFLLLSVAATTLNYLLLDLGNNVRQLMRQANLRPQAARDRTSQNPASFSRTAV